MTLRPGRKRAQTTSPVLESVLRLSTLVAAGGFLGEQHPQDLGVLPALRGRVGNHLRRRPADVWEPEPSEDSVELVRQRRWGRRLDGHRPPPNWLSGAFRGRGSVATSAPRAADRLSAWRFLGDPARFGVFIVRIPPSSRRAATVSRMMSWSGRPRGPR